MSSVSIADNAPTAPSILVCIEALKEAHCGRERKRTSADSKQRLLFARVVLGSQAKQRAAGEADGVQSTLGTGRRYTIDIFRTVQWKNFRCSESLLDLRKAAVLKLVDWS